MKRKLLVTSVAAGLATLVSMHAFAQSANDATQDEVTKKESRLETVTVTGSLIPRSQIETASPIITISSQDLQTHGYRNVYDALKTMPVATGSVQDSQIANLGSFTPGATTVSLFGLDPGFTLILLNGHPLADYPLPYNGAQNITDLSNIPVEMVDHIDILTGAQSSIYGSSAIAGVVNIILKKNLDGMDVSFRGGGHGDGGGGNERLQISGGKSWGNLSLAYSVSLENQDPILIRQSFWKDRTANPLGTVAGRDFLQVEPFSGQYFDPGAAACAPTSGLFGGTVHYTERPNSGFYCGSNYDYGNTTLLNGSKAANGYVNLTYRLNDNAEVYAEVLASVTKQKLNDGPPFWSYFNQDLVQSANTFSGVFWDNSRQDYESIQRYIAPEEMGSADANDEKIYTRQYDVNVGMRGEFSAGWSYDLYYNRSQINTRDSEPWPLTTPLNNYYLGAQQGIDPYGYGFPAYTPNLANFYKPLTPAQFAQFTDPIQSSSVSWEQDLHLTVTNTELFHLPAGSVGLAGIVEVGNQAFNNPVDPRLLAGDFNNRTGTQGAGSRNRYAIGGEMTIPVFSTLTADVSARYDSYDFAGRTDGKATYKAGLEYRPIDTLLLRANYATAFRAPDMLYVFQGSSGFFTTGNDYFLCRQQGFTQDNLSTCPQANESLFSFYHGSKDLKDITAKSYGYGVVWSPSAKFDIKLDYTHISISNEVETQTPDQLLQTEANCRLGTSFGGQAFDINSALCQNALSQVARYPDDFPFALAAGQLQNVTTFPVNIADEHLDGVQANATYRMDWGRFGNMALSGQYYIELNHEQRLDPGDPFIDLLHNFNSYELKSKTSASASWAIDKWTATVFGTLYGKTINFAGTATNGRWAQFNTSLQYDFGDNASILLSVNNVFNRQPPLDFESTGPSSALPPPYYNPLVYNGLGRLYWLEYKFHF